LFINIFETKHLVGCSRWLLGHCYAVIIIMIMIYIVFLLIDGI